MHIPSLNNADVPPGRPYAFSVSHRDRLVNEGTATWSGAPDTGSSRWASNYQLEFNDNMYPDSHWQATGRLRPEPPETFLMGAPSPEKKKHPGLRLALSSAGLSGGDNNDIGESGSLSTRRPASARPARPLTARERQGGANTVFEHDRVKRALGIPEVPSTSGWTGHLPQRKAGDFNVGHTYTSAYGSITARSTARDGNNTDRATPRSSTPVAGYSGHVLRAKEVQPGMRHTDVMHAARTIGALDTHTGSATAKHVPSSLRKSTSKSYTDTPAHKLQKSVVCCRVVDIDTATGNLTYGNMPSDAFARETPSGNSRNGIPRLAVHPKTGTVQHNKHVPAAIYMGDLTSYWTTENPYVTSAMAFNQHADKRHPDNANGQAAQWQNFKPCTGYLGFVPQNGPQNRLAAAAADPKRASDSNYDGGGTARISWGGDDGYADRALDRASSSYASSCGNRD